MIDFFDPYGIRESARVRNAQRKIHNLEDADARADRLLPDVIVYWTRVITHIQGTVPASERPCSYKPWSGALREYSRIPSYIGELPSEPQSMSVALMGIAQDVAQPGWPEARSDLIEFALAFLEADVMLFRSGYTKKHLIKRLQQSPLSDAEISRVDVLLRRAVLQGTGLEEARAFRRLAARLCVQGYLPDLAEWLREQSHGAIVTFGRLGYRILEGFSEQDQVRLISRTGNWRSKWGVVYPLMNEVVPAGELLKEPDQQIKSSAFYMLDHILNRIASPSSTIDPRIDPK